MGIEPLHQSGETSSGPGTHPSLGPPDAVNRDPRRPDGVDELVLPWEDIGDLVLEPFPVPDLGGLEDELFGATHPEALDEDEHTDSASARIPNHRVAPVRCLVEVYSRSRVAEAAAWRLVM
jgi:hypothetical protein